MNEVDDFDCQCRSNVDGRGIGKRAPGTTFTSLSSLPLLVFFLKFLLCWVLVWRRQILLLFVEEVIGCGTLDTWVGRILSVVRL